VDRRAFRDQGARIAETLMSQRRLALILTGTLAFAFVVDAALAVMLALRHKWPMIPFAGFAGFVPGIVIAAQAWRGRLPSTCAAQAPRR
jgi:hypothetical protein